ncbi:MAG: VOC family protein [Lachnospiraceae bacterium]
MTDGVRLGNVMVDCGDEQALQSFYGQLLNWETATLFGRPAVRSAEGVVFLFCQEEDYVPPVWPEKDGCQQKQMHFDFQVDSVRKSGWKGAELRSLIQSACPRYGEEQFVCPAGPGDHSPSACAEKEGKHCSYPKSEIWTARAAAYQPGNSGKSAGIWFGIPEAREGISPSTGRAFFAAEGQLAAGFSSAEPRLARRRWARR